MSSKLPPRGQVIRRRVREPVVIQLKDVPKSARAPHVRKHAKTFALALAVMVFAGGVLLATPWVTESGEATPAIDALFIAVSAASLTGLVTLDTADHWNFAGELVILLLIQAGGLGFMVGAGLLLQMLRRGQSRLSDVMLMQDGAPTLSPREAIELTGRIVRFTFAAEGIGALLLTLRFWRDMPFSDALWHGVFHAVSAFCNAGFDLQGSFASLGAYRSSFVINLVIVGLVQAGALSYMVFADLHRCRSWAALTLDTKLVLLVNAVVLAGSSTLFLIGEWNRSLAGEAAATKGMAAIFQGVVARTAGFATIDWSLAHTSTLFLWILVMAVGGAAGSTAGGVKLATVGVVFMAVISTLRGSTEPRAFGRTIPTVLMMRAVSVIFVFMAVHFVATLCLVVTEHFFRDDSVPFLALMYEAMSAAATVGASAGVTPLLTDAGKLVLCATMFFGRLGPLTTAYALQRRQRPTRYRFPTAQVRIG